MIDEDPQIDEDAPTAEVLAGDEAEDVETRADGDDGESEDPRPARRQQKPATDTVEGLFEDVAARRGREGDSKLRSQLSGPIRFSILDRKQDFLIDWTGKDLSIQKDSKAPADCSIALSSDDLLSIARGRLNPQIAMLSHKVKVEGKMELAVYVFNLFV